MKHLKKYKLFESNGVRTTIHPNNTNITELDSSFVYDIIDICVDLDSDFPQTNIDGGLISFYSPAFRMRLKDPLPEYPSISIHMPHYMYGYSFGDSSGLSIECPELKQVALRIKSLLGDSYKGFVLMSGSKNIVHTLSDNTSLYYGTNGFQIVYDPTKFLKGYKLYESNQTLLSETISDICLDLEDEGYYTSVVPESEGRKYIQTLRITKCNEDYIPDLSLGFSPFDIQDTLDRIYTVIGTNLMSTSIRLYNNRIDYYDVRMLDEIGHQSIKKPGTLNPFGLYPKVKIYGIEIRFFQPGDYGTKVITNESYY